MATTTLPPPPCTTANPAPVRSGGSVRRTTSIDVAWPDGVDGDRRLLGRARDYLTPSSGAPGRVLDGASMEATLDADQAITAIAAYPEPAKLQQLIGERGGGHLRMMVQQAMPQLVATGAPLYLLLDDISGVALVSAWARAQWEPGRSATLRERISRDRFENRKVREGVCWGLQSGSSGMLFGRPLDAVSTADAGELLHPDDPEGWHEFPAIEGPSFRRARRIDVVRDEDEGVIRIDAAFQDSAPTPAGGRAGIHEYRLAATADADTLEILTLEPDARILPFAECPGAVHNTQRLIGARITELRAEVLTQLRGPQGCTHLNDALRALAEVPRLASYLDGAIAA